MTKLCTAVLAIALVFATATPARADGGITGQMLCGMIYNGCFWPEAGFDGREYDTIIYYPGCWWLPDSKSYATSAARKIVFYAGSDCTGENLEVNGFGWSPDLGFTVRSYYYK